MRHRVHFGLAMTAGLLLLTCSRTKIGDRPELLEVPQPNLSAAEPAVQEQVARQRQELDQLLAAAELDANATAEAFSNLGLAFILYDFTEAAQICMLNAQRLAPGDYRWHYLVGYVQNLEGRLDEAVPSFEQALELQDNFLPGILRLGQAKFELGDYEAARALFERGLELNPESAAALEGLGKLAVAQGDHARAARYFQKALAAAPIATSLHYALAQTYRNLGRLDEARVQLERSGDVGVPIPDPLISPLAVLGESAQFYLVQGGEALNDKNYDVAAGAYKRALEKDPGSFIAYKGLGYALEKLGDIDSAIQYLQTALEKGTSGNPDKDPAERAEVLRVLGGLEAFRGQDDEAISLFRQSLELKEDQPGTRMKLANALARQERFEQSIAEFDRLLAIVPEYEPEILVKRATVLINLDRGPEALADFRRAVEQRPDDGRLRLRYAEALEYLGDRQGAQEQRDLAERQQGESSEQAATLIAAANTLARQGRLDAAVEGFAEALEHDPERVDARFQRALLLGHLQRFEEALAEFERIIEQEPRHAAARRAYITTLVLVQQYGPARVELNEAMRLFSRDAELAHLQARLLATVPDEQVRDGELALQVSMRLVQAVDKPRVRETLAMALAETGAFERAARIQRDLVEKAEESGDAALARDFRIKLQAFELQKAWWASSPEEILSATLETEGVG